MNSSYHTDIVNALDQVTPPRFDFAKIQERSRALRRRTGSGRKTAIAAIIALGVPCLAAAAVMLPPPALQHAIVKQLARWNVKAGGRPVFQMGSPLSLVELRSTASFHVVLPSGLPPTATLIDVVQGGEGNALYTLTYQLARGRKAWFTLQKKSENTAYVPFFAIVQSDDSGRSVHIKKYPAEVWSTGDEVVTLASDGLTRAQTNKIKDSMNGVDVPLHKGPIR